jgi:hypothetical protein
VDRAERLGRQFVQFQPVGPGDRDVGEGSRTRVVGPGVVGDDRDARLESQDALLLDGEGVGVLTFEAGVPVSPESSAVASAVPGSLTTRWRTSRPRGSFMIRRG